MKKIGIIGGLGPESTMEYYREIIKAFNTEHTSLAYPEIILYSANLNRFMKLAEGGHWPEVTTWLLEIVHSLQRSGADFAAIASNTPHIIFDELNSKSAIPLVSIVEAVCTKILDSGYKRPGLMGTGLTMKSDYYKKPLISNGISVVVPREKEQALIHNRLFSEIEFGIIKDSTRNELLSIAERMKDEDGIDSLILGCTELPLILPDSGFGIPFLNTLTIHCESIISRCLGNS